MRNISSRDIFRDRKERIRPQRQGRATNIVMKKEDFEVLSEFRYQMRRFERFSQDAIQAEGITPLQYLLLLHLKGFKGREWANVGEIATRLQAKPHGVVALITRCEALGMVTRVQSAQDRRQIEVHLLDKGKQILNRLAALHRAELAALNGVFTVPVISTQD
jgi:DNA-binding MarR family transcriptional regulator